MKEKFWLCKRGNIYVSLDSETGKRESLRTGNKEEAKRPVEAKNNATRQPALNLSIAKAYLAASATVAEPNAATISNSMSKICEVTCMAGALPFGIWHPAWVRRF